MARTSHSCAFTSLFLILCFRLLPYTNAELWTSNRTIRGVCSELTLDANATGAANVSGRYGASTNDLGTWRVSVESRYSADDIETAENNPNATSPNAAVNIWLDPWQNIDLNSGSNDYSACAYIFRRIPRNTMLRGQDDDTSCKQMLSEKCVKAIETKIAYHAQYLVAQPTYGPYSNLTPPILEPICGMAFGLLGHGFDKTFPEECTPFFDDGTSNWPLAGHLVLTGNVSVPTDCKLQSSRFTENFAISGLPTPSSFPPGVTFQYNGTSPANAYDNLTQEVFPILTLIMPPANNSRQSSIGSAYAQMSCIRAQNTTAVSRVAPSLPEPTPVHLPGTLSKGAIAGIVVGSLLGAALLAGVGWWFWTRQKKRKAASSSGQPDDKVKDLGSDERGPQIDSSNVYQLSSKEKSAQLHGHHQVEMSADVPPKNELEGSYPEPRELLGSVPVR